MNRRVPANGQILEHNPKRYAQQQHIDRRQRDSKHCSGDIDETFGKPGNRLPATSVPLVEAIEQCPGSERRNEAVNAEDRHQDAIRQADAESVPTRGPDFIASDVPGPEHKRRSMRPEVNAALTPAQLKTVVSGDSGRRTVLVESDRPSRPGFIACHVQKQGIKVQSHVASARRPPR